ncbi:MAG: FAD-dependent oxidoreductase [Candidatus Accumulibacter sp.]|nr:FAD-dependent oxidoreductase [Accumulibacter sp.]
MIGKSSPPLRDIVLIGGGHSHVGVLRAFALRPLPGVRLTVICTDTDTPYSGMLPGYVAGHYRFDEVHIDLRRLAAWAGARYFHDEVTGIDREARRVGCRQRPGVAYDLLSINIGSTPDWRALRGAVDQVLPVKPIRHFNERWLALLDRVRGQSGAMTIAVVGAGAGGVELTLAMQYRLRKERLAFGRDPDAVTFHLFSADAEILVTHNAAVRRAFEQVLRRRGVVIHRQAPVDRVAGGRLYTRAGEVFAADEIVWVTQAGGAAWLRDSGLALDERGFIRVHASLQSESDPLIFAAGDCASLIDRPLEKAGVFAVRMGPPLAENLRRTIRRQPLVDYRPQRRWLALISTGDRHAVASRGAWCARGRLLWRWKDWIDRRFIDKYTRFDEPVAPRRAGKPPPLSLPDEERRPRLTARTRRGDDGEVDPSIVSRALARARSTVADPLSSLSLLAQDPAARVSSPGPEVDTVRAFIDDPWLFGRIAANHALGATLAVEVPVATALLTVEPGADRQVEETIFQILAGVMSVLAPAGCALRVGAVGEGAELALALALDGPANRSPPGEVGLPGMRAGEVLLLSKPLGGGALLTAHRRLHAPGRWLDAALATMQQAYPAAARCLRAHDATACRVVGDGGVVGALLTMCQASGVDAELTLNRLPLLAGAAASAVESRPAPATARLAAFLRHRETVTAHAAYPLLFGPEIAGGLLASVPRANAEACLAELQALGYAQAASVGRCLPPGDPARPISVTIEE